MRQNSSSCAHEGGLDALFLNVSFVGSDPLAAALGNLPVNVIVTQVVPSPFGDDLQIVRDYRTDIKAVDPAAKFGFGSMEGYIAARIFVTGLEKVSGTPTRGGIVNAFEGLGQFDLGLGAPLFYSPTEHQACHRVWPTILRDGAFVPFDWKDIAGLTKGTVLQ